MISRAKILIVEDSMIVSTHIESLLRAQGFEVLAVLTTGEEAVRFSMQNNPDLILMDIILAGEINGIEAAEQIRSGCASPVIFLTAMTDKSTLEKAKRTGPSSYIVKPFDELDLLTRVELALYKSKLESESQRRRLETLIEGQEMERARISRDLHDGIGQLLNAVKLNMDAMGIEALGKSGEKIHMLINEAVTEVRKIAENLLPARLQNADLVSCLSHLCTTNETPAVRVKFQTEANHPPVSDLQKTMIYRITQEALQNAIRHGHSSLVFVQLYAGYNGLHLTIEDNGTGFDVRAAGHGHGLNNIRYRAEILRATCTIESTKGRGTLIAIMIPLN